MPRFWPKLDQKKLRESLEKFTFIYGGKKVNWFQLLHPDIAFKAQELWIAKSINIASAVEKAQQEILGLDGSVRLKPGIPSSDFSVQQHKEKYPSQRGFIAQEEKGGIEGKHESEEDAMDDEDDEDQEDDDASDEDIGQKTIAKLTQEASDEESIKSEEMKIIQQISTSSSISNCNNSSKRFISHGAEDSDEKDDEKSDEDFSLSKKKKKRGSSSARNSGK